MPRKSAHDQLAQHDRQVAEAQARARDSAGAIAEASDRIEALKQARIQSFSQGHEHEAAKLAAERSTLESAIEELEERRLGAELAAQRAHTGRSAFLTANVSTLLAELGPAGRDAAQAIEQTAAALQAARVRWHEIEGKVTTLLRAVQGDTRAVPSLEAVDRATKVMAAAVADGVPVPTPSAVVQTVTPTRVTALVEGS